jgi:hypothetical protein
VTHRRRNIHRTTLRIEGTRTVRPPEQGIVAVDDQQSYADTCAIYFRGFYLQHFLTQEVDVKSLMQEAQAT